MAQPRGWGGLETVKLLFVVGHPAHVHLFRNAIGELRLRGHEVKIAAVEKETTTELLAVYDLDFTTFGRSSPNLIEKALDTPLKDLRLVRLLLRERPNLVISTGSPYAAQASAIQSVPHIAFSDTEVASAVLHLMAPFTDAICTPSCFQLTLGKRQVRYNGYKELAYLHPTRFHPAPDILGFVNAKPKEPIIVVRISSWDSSHDLGERGMRSQLDERTVSGIENLESLGRIIITSERGVPQRLRRFLVKIPVNRMHDLLYYATLYVGEGATMASEAGVLGTPWVFISKESRGFLDDQRIRYGLGFWETDWASGLARTRELMSMPDLKQAWAKRSAKMIAEKVDVTSFIVDFIEGWPASRNALAEQSAVTYANSTPGSKFRRI